MRLNELSGFCHFPGEMNGVWIQLVHGTTLCHLLRSSGGKGLACIYAYAYEIGVDHGCFSLSLKARD